ncbi:Diacylglycerol kinase family enzyme [Actinoalloteichus cyanogriseus DSM 43889]|uniref:Diacylglycerol kinase family enzyme n=1 Tax=Actinoalloteichus caeruleus DSM 43889 TaxID=1120930 RepID=A0ABT1JMI8_ACTCY|nr:Diacylglycerol kinase family enzyme [Actinoalloteichus caeruleus DSM 43889]
MARPPVTRGTRGDHGARWGSPGQATRDHATGWPTLRCVRALLVVNPQATSTTSGVRDVLAHALASTVRLEVAETDYRGHAADAAARAMDDGVDLVVALGGDGTVNEVVNGLLRRGVRDDVPALGVVPGGMGNVFARALGMPRDPVEATHQLLTAIEEGRSRRVGLGRANGRWFTFNAGVGWDADVIAGVERLRARGREASAARYVRIAVANYFRLVGRRPLLTATLPGREPVTGLHLAFVSNTDPWTYLGRRPLHVNPGASFDGGLGVFGLRSTALPTVLRHLGQVVSSSREPKGRAVLRVDDVPSVVVRCARPTGLQVDGDFLGHHTTIEFSATRNALQVVV